MSIDNELAGDGSQYTGVRRLKTGPEDSGQRIDNFLIRHCPGVPRSLIYRLIRKGQVRVNGKRVKQTRRLASDEEVRVPPLQIRDSGPIVVPEKLQLLARESVLYEHPDFLVVCKPCGVAVHGGSGLKFGYIDALRQGLQEPSLELAHRLDRATSGVLLIGRSRPTTRALQDLFRQRTISKQYLALVEGGWPKSVREVNVPLRSNVEMAGERRVIVDREHGQPARTLVRVAEQFSHATLLDVSLDTGRTHQIRVHARHIGHPVIGDDRYGQHRSNRAFRRIGLGRLFLHASSLSFSWKDKPVTVTAETDGEWCDALDVLRQRRDDKVMR